MNTIRISLKEDLVAIAKAKPGGEIPCRMSAESDIGGLTEEGHFVYARCTPGLATHKVVYAQKARKVRVYLRGRLIGVVKV